MKVIVRCPKNRVTKSEMEQIIESLFQENKDLRVHVGHLRDELNLSQQQSEARRQVICERDKLIQELNEEVQASNDELENVHCDLVDHVKLQEEMCDTIDNLRTKVANVGAERDNFEASYKQVIQWWGNEQTKAREAEARAEEYRIALMESDCRVDELEKQLAWVREEVARLTNERDTAVNENTIMTFDINELRDKWEVERNLRVEAEKAYDKVASEAYDMHQQITNLTIDNTRLENRVEELSELKADYDALVQTKREYGEEIDRLRKVVTNLQSTRFTTDEFLRMIAREFMPSTGKGFADSVDF